LRLLSLSNCPLTEDLGSGYVAVNYARCLRALGHTVDLLGPADYEPARWLRRGTQFRQAWGMLRVARSGAPRHDIVEFYGAEGWLAVSRLARRRHRPFLLVMHSNGIETHCLETLAESNGESGGGLRPRRQALEHQLAERAFRQSDAVVTVSEDDLEYAASHDYGRPGWRLALENPLPHDYLGLEIADHREETITFCGSWLPRKGIRLIQADLPSLLREFPAWRLRLVGVGHRFEPRDYFPEDVQSRIDVVPFAGRGTQLRRIYLSSAIVIAPSLYEGFGLVAAEALACGCALVAGRTGLGAALRDGEEALILPDSQPESLYHCLARLIGDPPLRRRLGAAGHQRVQRLTWDRAGRTLAAAYEGWLAEHRARR
jgi:glycosyltransferase involved in cell wall biosynthesis